MNQHHYLSCFWPLGVFLSLQKPIFIISHFYLCSHRPALLVSQTVASDVLLKTSMSFAKDVIIVKNHSPVAKT